MATVDYTARFLTATYLERDRSNALALGVYRDGALVEPTQAGSSLTLCSPGGTAVVSGAAITVASSLATATVSAATLAGQAFGAGWRIEWLLVMPDGNHLFTNDAALVRCRPAPKVTDADLLMRHVDLNDYLGSSTSFQAYIDAAWVEIINRLEGLGRRPELIVQDAALYRPHLLLTLSILCRSFGGTGAPDNKWNVLAGQYMSEYEAAFSTMAYRFADPDTGDRAPGRRTGPSAVWLGAAPLGIRP